MVGRVDGPRVAAPGAFFGVWALYRLGRGCMVGSTTRTDGEAEMARRARKSRARKKRKANHGKRPVSR